MIFSHALDAARAALQESAATTVLLIRHAATAAVGYRLAGRLAGVPLTGEGREQAARLCASLRRYPLSAIYSSPLQRALDTARPLADDRGLAVREWDVLNEVDFGAWTGLTFEELDRLPAWRRFNERRSRAVIPGGESAGDVQARILRAIDDVHSRHGGTTVALVSHADVIRAAVLHIAGVPLDCYDRFDISPASVTALRIGDGGPELVFVGREGVPALTVPPGDPLR